jgi:hypothetical protein
MARQGEHVFPAGRRAAPGLGALLGAGMATRRGLTGTEADSRVSRAT